MGGLTCFPTRHTRHSAVSLARDVAKSTVARWCRTKGSAQSTHPTYAYSLTLTQTQTRTMVARNGQSTPKTYAKTERAHGTLARKMRSRISYSQPHYTPRTVHERFLMCDMSLADRSSILLYEL